MKSEYNTSAVLSINGREEFSHELDFDWFPIDRSVFEVFGLRIRVPRIEIPQKKLVSGELDFHWFPADEWGFEMFGPRIQVSRIELPQSNVFPTNSIFIGSRSTDELRGERTPGSSSPSQPLKTPWEPHFGEICVYRLPSSQSRPRETELGFELPISIYP